MQGCTLGHIVIKRFTTAKQKYLFSLEKFRHLPPCFTPFQNVFPLQNTTQVVEHYASSIEINHLNNIGANTETVKTIPWHNLHYTGECMSSYDEMQYDDYGDTCVSG